MTNHLDRLWQRVSNEWKIWWDDEGCWAELGPRLLGPFATEEGLVCSIAEMDCIMATPRIVGYGVIVFDYPIPGVASFRAYTFPTLEEAVAATKAAWARGVEAHYAPIRRGDILAEERT